MAAATRTLRDVAGELTASTMSIHPSEVSDTFNSEYSESLSTLNGGGRSSIIPVAVWI